jgi:hypothetical protein
VRENHSEGELGMPMKKYKPNYLTNYSIGNYKKSMIEVYDKLKENVKYRKEWANKLPVGFTLPAPSEVFVPRVPKNEGLAHVEQTLAA